MRMKVKTTLEYYGTIREYYIDRFILSEDSAREVRDWLNEVLPSDPTTDTQWQRGDTTGGA